MNRFETGANWSLAAAAVLTLVGSACTVKPATCGDGGCLATGGGGGSAGIDAGVVTGVRQVHYVTRRGVTDVVVDDAVVPLKVWTLVGSTFTPVPVTFTADGGFLFEPPPGPYYLASGSSWLVSSARRLDLGRNVPGRANQKPFPDGGVPLFSVTATGLLPWGDSDFLQLASEDVNDLLALSPLEEPPTGATSLTAQVFGSYSFQSAAVAMEGDTAVVTQKRRTPLVGQDGGVIGGSYAAWASASVQGITTGAGQTTSLTLAMSPLTQKQITADWKAALWRSAEASVHPQGRLASCGLTVFAVSPDLSRGWLGFLDELLTFSFMAGIPNGPLAASYGNPSSQWGEIAEAYCFYGGPLVRLPGTAGETRVFAVNGTYAEANDLLGAPLAPAIGPPGSLAVEGSGAQATPLIIDETNPLLAWTAPASGSPSHYTVGVREVHPDAMGRATSRRLTFSLVTTETQARIPPGILRSGGSYVFTVAASEAAGGQFAPASAPFYEPLSDRFASTISSLVTIR